MYCRKAGYRTSSWYEFIWSHRSIKLHCKLRVAHLWAVSHQGICKWKNQQFWPNHELYLQRQLSYSQWQFVNNVAYWDCSHPANVLDSISYQVLLSSKETVLLCYYRCKNLVHVVVKFQWYMFWLFSHSICIYSSIYAFYTCTSEGFAICRSFILV